LLPFIDAIADILFQKLKGYEAKIMVATSEGNGDAMG